MRTSRSALACRRSSRSARSRSAFDSRMSGAIAIPTPISAITAATRPIFATGGIRLHSQPGRSMMPGSGSKRSGGCLRPSFRTVHPSSHEGPDRGGLTMPTRNASARWDGSLTEGHGTKRMASGAYEGPYSFESRFEEGDGTNPEELIAAAHAGCFSMALSGELGRAGHEAENVETTATVHLDKLDEGFGITHIVLRTRARVPGIDADEFRQHAQAAKDGCPVSQALAAVESIEVDAELVT